MPLNQGYVYRSQARSSDAGLDVLSYHVARYAHSDRDEWRREIEAGRVLVDDRVATCDQVLRAGDRLQFLRPPWDEPDAPRHFRVVHEDAAILVVEKPAGLQVLPAGPFTTTTLLHLVRESDASRAECAPIHRLGRGTSGLVLFGKTTAARADLSLQFRVRTAVKTYLALASGTTLPVSCIARHSIGKRAHGPLQIDCVRPDGKPSITRIRVLARDAASNRSLVAAQPITGRPDQIRIHLAACGAPLVGDPLYGPGGLPFTDARPGEGGYFLHAAALRIIHPTTGRPWKVSSRPEWL